MDYGLVQEFRGEMLEAIREAVGRLPTPEYRRAALEALLLTAAGLYAGDRELPVESGPELVDVMLRAMGDYPMTAQSTGVVT